VQSSLSTYVPPLAMAKTDDDDKACQLDSSDIQKEHQCELVVLLYAWRYKDLLHS